MICFGGRTEIVFCELDPQDAFVELLHKRDKLNERKRQAAYRTKHPDKINSGRKKHGKHEQVPD